MKKKSQGVTSIGSAARRALRTWALIGGVALLAAPSLEAQEETTAGERIQRAIPAGVTPPPEFQRAVQRGWRSEDGSPGHAYWQNWAGYDMTARLDPETGRLEGTARILYSHVAPAELGTVWLHLHQNLHKQGVARYDPAEITGGVTITSLAADGEELTERPLGEGPGYRIDGTLMEVRPSIRLEPGDTLQLDVEWEVTLPQSGAGRMGHSDREIYFVAYWFPKMAVFGNIRGWNPDQYLGNAEFFDEFGDYEVDITVPTGWTVMATGELQNPEEVYTAITLERLEAAATSDERVVIADEASRSAGTVTTDGTDGWLTYTFTAENVRDFAWTTSNVQRWDATSAVVVDPPAADEGDDTAEDDESDEEQGTTGAVSAGSGSQEGTERRVLIHSFWRPDRAPLWSEQWRYGKQSVEFHSLYTGVPYPWPHMTSVEGADIIGGGMEFPMMTVMGSYQGRQGSDLFNVTSHEIGHMWIPMIVGTNEKRYAWMDEGATTFLENESRMELWPGVDHHRVEARSYLQVAAAQQEVSMMMPGDYYPPGPSYGIASYPKPSTLLVALRSILGDDVFREAYRTFVSEWAYKHPTPWDFFNTFERFAGEDLDWFWTSFYYETWTVDHAVQEVARRTQGGFVVRIVDEGHAVFPARVTVRTAAGGTTVHEIPVDYWLAGNTTFEIEVPASSGAVTRVEVDGSGYVPDVDRSDNFWPRG
ncbi:MAG: M1 family metallopeptidase [Longimicrobiales bacterium]|nr:M1 family metallopeptidase [Longimicrobiales bacterium]